MGEGGEWSYVIDVDRPHTSNIRQLDKQLFGLSWNLLRIGQEEEKKPESNPSIKLVKRPLFAVLDVSRHVVPTFPCLSDRAFVIPICIHWEVEYTYFNLNLQAKIHFLPVPNRKRNLFRTDQENSDWRLGKKRSWTVGKRIIFPHTRQKTFCSAVLRGKLGGGGTDGRTMDDKLQTSLVRPGGVRILSREMVEQIHGLGEEGKLDLKHV